MEYKKVTLKEIAELLRNGASIKQGTDDSGFPITRIETIANGSIDPSRMGYAGIVDKKKYEKFFLRNGDILISHINSEKHLGKCAIYKDRNEEFIHGMNLLMFRPLKEVVYPNFVYYFFKSPFFLEQLPKITKKSVNQASMSIKDIKELEIPLPPKPIQIKMANALDKAQELIDNKKIQIKKYDELLQSIFLDMFGDPKLNKQKWDVVFLENVTNKVTDGVHAKPEYTEKGVEFISVKDISKGVLNFDKSKYISKEAHQKYFKRCNPQCGDILYTKVGATYGRPVIVNVEREFSLYVSVALLKPKHEKINSVFFKNLLKTRALKYQADRSIKGIGVPDLHLKEIKKFKLILPPLEFQNQFASIAKKIEIEKKKMEDSLVELENNFNSIMQRAFRGELF